MVCPKLDWTWIALLSSPPGMGLFVRSDPLPWGPCSTVSFRDGSAGEAGQQVGHATHGVAAQALDTVAGLWRGGRPWRMD